MKLFAVTVNAKGKAFAMLFFSIVVLPLAPVMANPILKGIYFFIADRVFSFAIEKRIIQYNILLIESIVDEEVEHYLAIFKKAEDLPKDAPKELVNEVANELFDISEKLWSNRRPGDLLQLPT